MMDDAIKGIDSTVPVTSCKAYNFFRMNHLFCLADDRNPNIVHLIDELLLIEVNLKAGWTLIYRAYHQYALNLYRSFLRVSRHKSPLMVLARWSYLRRHRWNVYRR